MVLHSLAMPYSISHTEHQKCTSLQMIGPGTAACRAKDFICGSAAAGYSMFRCRWLIGDDAIADACRKKVPCSSGCQGTGHAESDQDFVICTKALHLLPTRLLGILTWSGIRNSQIGSSRDESQSFVAPFIPG